MKICIISPMQLPIPAEKGGAIETIIDQLLSENEKNKKIQIDVFSIPGNSEKVNFLYSSYSNINYISIPKAYMIIQNIVNFVNSILYKTKIRDFYKTDFFYKKIAQMCKREDYDFIIFEGGSYSCARYFLKSYGRERMILHLHHTLKTAKYDSYFGNVICVSEFVKNKFLEHSNIPSDNVHVLKNVIDHTAFEKRLSIEQKDNIKKRLNIKDEKILLFCGRIVEEKGIRELLLAFQKAHINDLKLIVIGSSNFGKKNTTPFEREIFKLINQNPNVIYLGFVINKELYKYYQIADVFIMPSLYEEAAGLVNLEAMLSSTPIITTKYGGIPEYVCENDAVFINTDVGAVEGIKNAITYLILDDNKRMFLSIKDSNRIKDITTIKYYRNFVQILNGLGGVVE